MTWAITQGTIAAPVIHVVVCQTGNVSTYLTHRTPQQSLRPGYNYDLPVHVIVDLKQIQQVMAGREIL